MIPARSQLSGDTSLRAPAATRGRRRPLVLATVARLALAVPIAVLAFGCTADGPLDDTDNNVLLIPGAFTATSNPFGDVITTAGVILDDSIDLDFTAHLKAPISTATTTSPELQDILLERYEVVYERLDGGAAVPSGFERGISARVRLTPLGADSLRTTTINIVVVPSTIKAQPPLSFLIDPGIEPVTNFTSIQVDAVVTFFGRTLAGNQVTAVARIGINFANYGDSNS